MAMSVEYRSKFAALHRQWRLQMSEKISRVFMLSFYMIWEA